MLKKTGLMCLLVIILLCFCACENKEQQQPTDINDLQTKISVSNSQYTTTFEVLGNVLTVQGTTADFNNDYFMVVFDSNTEDAAITKAYNGSYMTQIKLPDKNKVLVELYSGKDKKGAFNSVVTDFLFLAKTENLWNIEVSPVYENNENIFFQEKNISDYLKNENDIQSDDLKISSLARQITYGIESEYEQALAVHDWVAENIYYDYEALLNENSEQTDALSVLINKRAACQGYSNLMAALLRSCLIPCKVQQGYVLNVNSDKQWTSSNINETKSNHTWNEAYVDGRWIIIDVAYDSQNKYQNGQYVIGDIITHTYFDSTLEFFSLSHKIIDKNASSQKTYIYKETTK